MIDGLRATTELTEISTQFADMQPFLLQGIPPVFLEWTGPRTLCYDEIATNALAPPVRSQDCAAATVFRLARIPVDSLSPQDARPGDLHGLQGRRSHRA